MAERRDTVKEFINKNSVHKICTFAGISTSSFYYQKNISDHKPQGRPPPGYTKNRDGRIIYDELIIQTLIHYRSSKYFLSGGGSKKLTKYLRIEHSLYINHKKIYRICHENKLLLFKKSEIKSKKIKKIRCSYLEVSKLNELWQFDLKYVWIHGENRWCFLLAFIDVISKKITGYYIGKTCKSGDLVFTLNQAIKNENITSEQMLTIRSDNGPQMSSNKFYFYLKRLENKLKHEFIPPRSPDRNAFIEAFNSIIENELLKFRYFKTYSDAYEALVDFIGFYNNRRIHGSIGDISPKMFIEKIKNGEITPQVIAV